LHNFYAYDDWDNYTYTNAYIAEHITEWIEVDDKTLKDLISASKSPEIFNKIGNQFYVIEKLSENIVRKTIEDYVELARIQAEKDAERKRRAEETRAKRTKTALQKKQTELKRIQKAIQQLEEEKENGKI